MPLSIVALNKARRRLIDMHYRAKVGHLGGNLSCLDAMMLVHHEYLEKVTGLSCQRGILRARFMSPCGAWAG